MFEVGQKVVCVTPEGGHIVDPSVQRDLGITEPTRGTVYTVRGILVRRDMECIYLEEIVNGEYNINYVSERRCEEPPFAARFFRPVHELKTDISIFKEIDDKVFRRAPELV